MVAGGWRFNRHPSGRAPARAGRGAGETGPPVEIEIGDRRAAACHGREPPAEESAPAQPATPPPERGPPSRLPAAAAAPSSPPPARAAEAGRGPDNQVDAGAAQTLESEIAVSKPPGDAAAQPPGNPTAQPPGDAQKVRGIRQLPPCRPATAPDLLTARRLELLPNRWISPVARGRTKSHHQSPLLPPCRSASTASSRTIAPRPAPPSTWTIISPSCAGTSSGGGTSAPNPAGHTGPWPRARLARRLGRPYGANSRLRQVRQSLRRRPLRARRARAPRRRAPADRLSRFWTGIPENGAYQKEPQRCSSWWSRMPKAISSK